MSEGNELILPGGMESTVPAEMVKETEAVAKGSDFLPRLQVCSFQTTLVQDAKIQPGRYAIVQGQNFVDLGVEVECVSISFHPMALDLRDEESPKSYYNRNSAEFKMVQATATSGASNTKCMFGPEFLIWIPSQQKFVSFFCGGISARIASTGLLTLMKRDDGTFGHKNVTFGIERAENKKGKWHVPTFRPNSSLTGPQPDPDAFMEILTKFNNPQDSKPTEKAPEAANAGRAR